MHRYSRPEFPTRRDDPAPAGPLSDLAGIFTAPGLRPGDTIEWLVDRVLSDRSNDR